MIPLPPRSTLFPYTTLFRSMSISEHDLVVLNRDFPEHGLRLGDVGTAVHVYADGKAFEVEFVTGSGQTLAVRSEEHTSELQSLTNLVCRLLLEKKKKE